MWLDHLKRLRSTGANKWRSICPVHDGDNPSALAIKQCEDNSYVVHCFVCGANGQEVFEALGLDIKELMGDSAFKVKQKPTDIYEQTFVAIVESEKAKGNYVNLADKRKARLIKAKQENS